MTDEVGDASDAVSACDVATTENEDDAIADLPQLRAGIASEEASANQRLMIVECAADPDEEEEEDDDDEDEEEDDDFDDDDDDDDF